MAEVNRKWGFPQASEAESHSEVSYSLIPPRKCPLPGPQNHGIFQFHAPVPKWHFFAESYDEAGDYDAVTT